MTDLDGTDTEGTESEGIRRLRDHAKALEAQVKELQGAQRELAVTKAGIDTGNPFADLFIQSYKGEWTDAALREAAEKYPGLIAGATPAAETQPVVETATPVEQDALARMTAAAADAGAPAPPTAEWKSAKSAAEFLAKYSGLVAE